MFVLIIAAVILTLALSLFIGCRMAKKRYLSFEFSSDAKGIEVRKTNRRYNILWTNARIDQNKNGVIDIYDKNISSFMRNMDTNGWIQIPKEIEAYDAFLDEVKINRQIANP